MKNLNRFLELDAIRGLAALSIVLFHYASSYKWANYHPYSYFHYLDQCLQIFFIISGFVIILSIKRTSRSIDFFVSRFARLYPIYLFSVITTLLITNIARIAEPRTEKIYDIILNFFMLHDFFGGRSVNIVYWTLTVEICFYAVMFIIYRFKLVKYIDAICGFWLLFIFVNTAKAYIFPDTVQALNSSLDTVYEINNFNFTYPNQLGVLYFANQPVNLSSFISSFKDFIKNNFLLLQGRAVFFIAGIVLYQCQTLRFSPYRLALISLCIFIKAIDYSPDTPRYAFIFFAFFIVIMYLIITGRFKIISTKPLIFLGTISYSLYLSHLQVNWLVKPLFNSIPPEISIIIRASIAIIVASLLTFKIELPAMKFIKSQLKKVY
jgi:peptidoglycan/LPS O-acetylase OafA/YrhL